MKQQTGAREIQESTWSGSQRNAGEYIAWDLGLPEMP